MSEQIEQDGVILEWRGPLDDAEMVDLVSAHGATPFPGWWDRIRPHSFGWVTARDPHGRLVGFVNVVSDGDCHAFLIDTKTRGEHQRRASALASSRLRPSTQRRRATSGCTSTSTTSWRPSTSTPVASSRHRPA